MAPGAVQTLKSRAARTRNGISQRSPLQRGGRRWHCLTGGHALSEALCTFGEGGLLKMQREEHACALPSDGLLSSSDSWQTLIGQEHPSGHLVRGPTGAHVRAGASLGVCVISIFIPRAHHSRFP